MFVLQVTEMKSLIGFFNLDPSRVLDILLDAFCQQPANRAYLGLFKNFSRRVVSQFLGFKFQQQHVCCLALLVYLDCPMSSAAF